MVERTVKGIVMAWSNIDTGETKGRIWFRVNCKLDKYDDWFTFFPDTDKQAANMIKNSPVGSEVEFVQYQKTGSSVWKYKQKTFKVLKEGDGKLPDLEQQDIPEETVEDEGINELNLISNYKRNINSSDGFDFEYFKKLSVIKPKVEKKGNLNYISWADAWKELKIQIPDADFKVYENKDGFPYFGDKTGVYAKVGVEVYGIEHTVWLPVMDNQNKPIMLEDVNSFQINKTIQRAFAKAIALHGLGLFVFCGEDIPDIE